MKMFGRLLAFSVGLVLVACGAPGPGNGGDETPQGDEAVTTQPTPSDSSDETTVPVHPDPDRVPTTTMPPVTGEVPEDILERILGDASHRSDTGVTDLLVVRDQEVEWPDGSLGCPEPGQFYTQAVVSGYWVVIAAPDASYDYRVDGQGNFRLCENTIQPPSRGGSVTPTTTGSDS